MKATKTRLSPKLTIAVEHGCYVDTFDIFVVTGVCPASISSRWYLQTQYRHRCASIARYQHGYLLYKIDGFSRSQCSNMNNWKTTYMCSCSWQSSYDWGHMQCSSYISVAILDQWISEVNQSRYHFVPYFWFTTLYDQGLFTPLCCIAIHMYMYVYMYMYYM